MADKKVPSAVVLASRIEFGMQALWRMKKVESCCFRLAYKLTGVKIASYPRYDTSGAELEWGIKSKLK